MIGTQAEASKAGNGDDLRRRHECNVVGNCVPSDDKIIITCESPYTNLSGSQSYVLGRTLLRRKARAAKGMALG
jgi:hypothetical protein